MSLGFKNNSNNQAGRASVIYLPRAMQLEGEARAHTRAAGVPWAHMVLAGGAAYRTMLLICETAETSS